ncbi:MAG: DUF58 domain-containing protein [Mycobacteriales bacterium]|nr:MAG: DUF58 domain-containing protein [Pseudonocardiales bacterium]
MRAALRGLTTRGRCLLAAGLAALGCAVLLGEKDLLRVAFLLLALPLVSAIVVARARYRLSCTRTLLPDHVAISQQAEVHLQVQNVALLPTSPMLLEDELPYALGGTPRFVVERTGAGQRRGVRYSVRSELRGRFRIGPLRLRLSDPFGLVEVTRSFTSVETLTVMPKVVPLPVVRVGGAWSTNGTSSSRSVASRGEDDAATREYRHGDDLRKVHWRSTARVGALMVRREERPWQARSSLLLDTRSVGHRGDAPDSSFEWAVSAIASVGIHLVHRGHGVTLTTGGDLRGLELTSDIAILDRLADTRLTRAHDLDELAAAVRRADEDASLIAVFGLLTADQAGVLAGCRPPTAPNVAVLLESTSWLALSPDAAAKSHALNAAAGAEFTRGGWRVVRVARGDSIADSWARAGIGESGMRATFMEQLR